MRNQSPPITLRFSNLFHLKKRQSELDFVDVLVDTDIPLFIDPFAFRIGTDDWSHECNDLVMDFFQELINALRDGNSYRAEELLGNLHEPNETRLGVSRPPRGKLPKGRGVGKKQAASLYKVFAESKAVQTGLLTDLSDCELFIDGISHDKISDITINIIRMKLVAFTQAQCRLWNIPMRSLPTGTCWDNEAKEWKGGYEQLPAYKGYPLILVPKRAIRYRLAVDYREYYDKHVIEYIRQEYERQECLNSAASLTKVLRGGRRVTKKSVKEKYPASKEFLREFSEDNPSVLAAYKARAESEMIAGKHRPTDTGIVNTERTVANSYHLYLIEDYHAMNVNVDGDNYGAIGVGNHVRIRDINVFKQHVAGLEGLDTELKAKLAEARDVLEGLTLNDAAKSDAADDLGKLAEELAKPDKEKDEGRIRRLWGNIKALAPTVAAILGAAASVAKIVTGS